MKKIIKVFLRMILKLKNGGWSRDLEFRILELRLIIENLSFSVPKGAIVGIIGGNGAGKSTLFKIINGDEKPNSGHVSLGETVYLGYVDQSPDELAIYLPQCVRRQLVDCRSGVDWRVLVRLLRDQQYPENFFGREGVGR